MLMLINLHLLVTRMLLRGSCINDKLMKNVCSYILCPQCPYMNGKKIPLKSYMDFSVIYYIESSVVALFSVNPMNSVNLMSVKVIHDCIGTSTNCITLFSGTKKWELNRPRPSRTTAVLKTLQLLSVVLRQTSCVQKDHARRPLALTFTGRQL